MVEASSERPGLPSLTFAYFFLLFGRWPKFRVLRKNYICNSPETNKKTNWPVLWTVSNKLKNFWKLNSCDWCQVFPVKVTAQLLRYRGKGLWTWRSWLKCCCLLRQDHDEPHHLAANNSQGYFCTAVKHRRPYKSSGTLVWFVEVVNQPRVQSFKSFRGKVQCWLE